MKAVRNLFFGESRSQVASAKAVRNLFSAKAVHNLSRRKPFVAFFSAKAVRYTHSVGESWIREIQCTARRCVEDPARIRREGGRLRMSKGSQLNSKGNAHMAQSAIVLCSFACLVLPCLALHMPRHRRKLRKPRPADTECSPEQVLRRQQKRETHIENIRADERFVMIGSPDMPNSQDPTVSKRTWERTVAAIRARMRYAQALSAPSPSTVPATKLATTED